MFHGAKIDCEDDRKLTPLFYAAKAGSAINVFELCDNGAEVNHKIKIPSTLKTLPPEKVEQKNVSCLTSCMCCPVTKEQPSEITDHKIEITNVTQGEEQGEKVNALYFAKNLDVVDVLLEKGAKPTNRSMIQLINRNSDLARAVLDNCLSKKKDEKKEDKEILQMDFSIFQDEENDMSLFQETKDHTLEELLLHPMMKMFLHMKFFSMYMWKLYYTIALYFIVAVSFVALGYTYVQVEHCFNVTTSNSDKPSCFVTKIAHLTVCPEGANRSQVMGPSVIKDLPLKCNKIYYIEGIEGNKKEVTGKAIEELRFTSSLEKGCFWSSVVLTVLVFFGEFDQLWSLKINYFSCVENVVQFCLILITISFYVCHAMGDYSNAKIIVSWMVLLSCLNFTVVWARVDRMRPYVHMFVTVIKAMLWCILAFLPALMGFSNAFYLLLNKLDSFDNPVGAIIKTFAMAIGELDYSDNFDMDSVEEFGILGNAVANSKIMLVIFILGSLMFLNLMVSVSVNDVQSLYQESELIDMKQKINAIKEASKWGKWRQKLLTNHSDFKKENVHPEVSFMKLIFIQML